MNSSGTTDSQPQGDPRLERLERTCFVIMPFGTKRVGKKVVNFTKIYKEIFEPAIQLTTTPEDSVLIPARTDMDAFSASIDQEMFEYIMYSRLAFVDITGLNANVFYELGIRHSAHESGTVLVRQAGEPIPFDIRSIKIFEYDLKPAKKADASSALITRVLSQTLKQNRLDSPFRLALRSQWCGSSASGTKTALPDIEPVSIQSDAVDTWQKREIERFMRDAEEATRIGDLDAAATNYWGALRFDALNIVARVRLALTLKQQGKTYDAFEEFATITKLSPDYGEAWKEKGVIQGLIARKIPADGRSEDNWLPDGYASLERATKLIPNDFDAWSSLGGILKNVRGDVAGALAMYSRAAELSNGHPYPLLNALKLEALATGALDLDRVRGQLATAEKLRRGQSRNSPPTDSPWCFFDLAEISLYRGQPEAFLEHISEGIRSGAETWQVKTFRDSLNDTLVAAGIDLPGLKEGLTLLDRTVRPKQGRHAPA